MSRRGRHGKCEKSKLFFIENMRENCKDGLLKEIIVAQSKPE